MYHILANLNVSLRRPVLAFVMERHNLARIREAMATAVARATFFAHSFRVWNWLLKLVSTESRLVLEFLGYSFSSKFLSSLINHKILES